MEPSEGGQERPVTVVPIIGAQTVYEAHRAWVEMMTKGEQADCTSRALTSD